MVVMKRALSRLIPWLLGLLALYSIFYFFSTRELSVETIIKRTLQKEKKITSYYTLLETNINLGGATQNYYVEVWFNAPHFHRVEIFSSFPGDGYEPEQVFVSDGEKTWIYSPEIEDFYVLSPLAQGLNPPPFLLANFLSSFSEAQDAEIIGTEQRNGAPCYLLRIIPPSPGRRNAWEKVWLAKKSLLPVKIEIYDSCDQLQQTIVFHKTVINPEINPDIFKI
jgi:outer membrane lipoprotein-sorting protein